jgi:hypothetical protein
METIQLTSLCGIIAGMTLAVCTNDQELKGCMLWVLLICWPLLLWSSHKIGIKNNK